MSCKLSISTQKRGLEIIVIRRLKMLALCLVPVRPVLKMIRRGGENKMESVL